MRLARFHHGGTDHVGIVEGDAVADLGPDPGSPDALVTLVESAAARAATEQRVAAAPRIPLAEVALLAPVARPPKFLAIGLNYADHTAESGFEAPTFPTFFNKQSTCVAGPHDPIHVPRASAFVDYEGELGIVIARRCRHVPAARAPEVVAGFLVVNDVTVRDWQFKAPTWTLGKSFDTHGPIGPWIVTPDEVEDPHDLRLRTLVNGEVLQDASTKEMVFDCWQQIETLSTAFTLEPGDVIATGTPAGIGMLRQPPVLLRPGDMVTVEIERIGSIANPVIAEPDDTVRI